MTPYDLAPATPPRQPDPHRYPDRVSLQSLPALLRNEAAMTRVVGVRGATLAVATLAQAFVLSGLLRLGTRRPVLVVTPRRSWPTTSRCSPPTQSGTHRQSRSFRPGRHFRSSG
jgi:hypothetical protein